MPRVVCLGATAVLTAVLAGVPAARADGDPASDFLITQSVFAPYDSHIPDARAAQLRLLVKEAKARGFPVKIALVGTRPDLGTVIVLWRRPEQYARFLGQELRNWYRGPLLIVMPNGYGFSANGKAVARDQETLAGLPSPGRAPDLATAGIDGVRRLARQRGIQLAVPKAPHVAAQPQPGAGADRGRRRRNRPDRPGGLSSCVDAGSPARSPGVGVSPRADRGPPPSRRGKRRRPRR